MIEQQAFRPKAWSRMHRFGYRWRVEGAFSCIKRIFGEYVSAKKFVNIAKEMAMKALICNTFITIIKRDRIERGTSPRSKSRPTDLCNTAYHSHDRVDMQLPLLAGRNAFCGGRGARSWYRLRPDLGLSLALAACGHPGDCDLGISDLADPGVIEECITE